MREDFREGEQTNSDSDHNMSVHHSLELMRTMGNREREDGKKEKTTRRITAYPEVRWAVRFVVGVM